MDAHALTTRHVKYEKDNEFMTPDDIPANRSMDDIDLQDEEKKPSSVEDDVIYTGR